MGRVHVGGIVGGGGGGDADFDDDDATGGTGSRDGGRQRSLVPPRMDAVDRRLVDTVTAAHEEGILSGEPDEVLAALRRLGPAVDDDPRETLYGLGMLA